MFIVTFKFKIIKRDLKQKRQRISGKMQRKIIYIYIYIYIYIERERERERERETEREKRERQREA